MTKDPNQKLHDLLNSQEYDDVDQVIEAIKAWCISAVADGCLFPATFIVPSDSWTHDMYPLLMITPIDTDFEPHVGGVRALACAAHALAIITAYGATAEYGPPRPKLFLEIERREGVQVLTAPIEECPDGSQRVGAFTASAVGGISEPFLIHGAQRPFLHEVE